MNFRQFEIFEAVMRTGSLSEAARVLGVSQPAVSKSIRLAEQAAGFVLFRRARGRLYPSPEAEALLPEVRRVSEELRGMGILLKQLREGHAGKLTIACVASVAQCLVAPALIRLRGARSDTRIELLVLPTMQVADCVARSEADFGLIHQPVDNHYLDGEVICETQAVCVLPRKHPLGTRRVLTIRDLQDVPLISFRESTDIGWLLRRALAAAGGHRREPDIVINQSSQAIDFAQAGVGAAIVDPFSLLALPILPVAVVPFRPAIPNRLRIIRPRERPRSRLGATFARTLQQIVRERTASSPLRRMFRI
jgi:DNA-binding transcriptional LysR family regulator